MKMIKFEVFNNEKTLANILIFAAMVRQFSITIDTYFDSSINVHLRDGTSIMFKQ